MNELDRMRKLAGILTEGVMGGSCMSTNQLQTDETIELGDNSLGEPGWYIVNGRGAVSSGPYQSENEARSDSRRMAWFNNTDSIMYGVEDENGNFVDANTGTDYSNEVDESGRMRKLAGIMPKGVMAVPGAGNTGATPGIDEMFDNMDEKAPPGMEDVVMNLKKEYPGEPSKAFATAWSIYNKKHAQTDESSMNMDEGTAESNLAAEIDSAIDMFRDLDSQGLSPEEIVDSIELSFREDGCDDATIAEVLAAVQQHIENPPEEEDGHCTTCNGSGEGMYDGTRCGSCGGRGVVKGERDMDDFDEPDDYRDDVYEGADEEQVDEAFDLNNGYEDITFMKPGDFFPDGADGPVVSQTGPSGAKQGDNPEQKKMAVAETHKELVYNYRKYLNEEKSKDVLNKRIPGGLANKNVALDYKNMKKNKGGKIDKMFPLGGPKKGSHLPEEKSPKK